MLLVLFQLFLVQLNIIVFLKKQCLLIRYVHGLHLLLMFKLVPLLHQLQILIPLNLKIPPEALVHFLEILVVLLANLFVFEINPVELALQFLNLSL